MLRVKTLGIAVSAFAIALFACGEKPAEGPETGGPEVPEVPAHEVKMADVETGKTQCIEGLEYAYTLVGWDNGLASEVIGKTVTVLDAIAAESEEEDQVVIFGVKNVLTGVQTRLDDTTNPLSEAEVKSLEEQVLDAVTDLRLLWYPKPAAGGGVPEWYGDLMKKKWKEGGDLLKEKYKEGGDAMKEKWAEGHPE